MTTRPILRLLSIVLVSVALILICHNHTDARLLDIHRFSLVIGGDWANFGKMKNVDGTIIRDNLTGSAAVISSTIYKDRIASGPGLSVQILYHLKSRIWVGVDATYIMPDYFAYNRARHFIDDYYNRDIPERHLFEADLMAMGAVFRYQIPVDRLRLDLSVVTVWLSADARLMHTNWRTGPLPPSIPGSETTSFHADGIGYILSIGTVFGFSHLSIIPNAGYRFLRTGDVDGSDNYQWDSMRLEFSGPFVGMNFQLKP